MEALFTAPVKAGEPVNDGDMKATRANIRTTKPEPGAATVRATITFPTELYTTLGEIAKQKKVSLAWIVREAAEQYLNEKWPLLRAQS